MLNQGGLDLRYGQQGLGQQYQHAQQNFQALGGLQQGLQGLGAGGRMGLAGFPNTSAAPQQGQYQGLAGGTAGLQQGLRFMGPGVALGGGQMANQFPAGLNAVAAQRAQGLGQGIGQGLGQGIGQGLNLGGAGVRGGGAAAQQQAAAASLMLQRQQQQQQQFGAAAAQQFGGLGNLAGNPLQQLNAAQRQLALQQQQQQQQQQQPQQQQQQQSDLLALLAGGKAGAGHAGFGQGLGGLTNLGGQPGNAAAAAAAGVQASHALFGARQGGFAGGAAGLGGQAGAGGLGGLGTNLGPGGGGQGGLGMDALNAAAGDSSAAGRPQQQQQGGQQGASPGFNAEEFPALGAAVQAAAAAARGAVGPGQQQQQGAVGQGAGGRPPGAVDYSAAAMSLRKATGVGQDFSVQNDSDFPALGGASDADKDKDKGPGKSPGQGGADAPGATGLGGALTPAPAGTGGPSSTSQGLDRYGLLGLLHVIRMTEPDLTMLALGTDLTGLGLNLNSPDPLYKVLVSPLADAPVRADLDFEVPACYKHNPPRLQPGYLAKFKEETLFYIFYSMPQDEAQLIAADELCARGWWWHKKFRCWFIHAPNNPVVKNATARSERGTYLFFDTSIWDVVQKSDVEVFFEDVERPPGLPRANAAGGAPATAGMQPQIGAAGQQQQQQQQKAAGAAGPAQAAPTGGLLRQ